jgi:phenylalanyl-tRNA synthetase beta chain
MSHMRPSLLPGLLRAAARNQARGFADLALFEVGPVFKGGEPGEQEAMIAGLLVGHTAPRDRLGSRRPVDVWDARTDAEAILTALGAPEKLTVIRQVDPWWHPGRSAKLGLGPKLVLAGLGEVHPRVLAALDVKGPAVAFAIHLDAIPHPKARTTTRPALALSDFQAVERDFAFVVDERVEAVALVNAAQSADKALIGSVRVFDEFIGGSLGAGKKSLALTVRLQPIDRTLTDKDIDEVAARVVDKVTRATGGVLRG